MKKIALVIAMAIASLNVAQAQTEQPRPLRFFVGAGLTTGGDKVHVGEYVAGVDGKVKAGGTISFDAGVDYRFAPAFSMKASLGYHYDESKSDVGNLRLKRLPFEVLAYYHTSPNVRVGGGVRVLTGTKFTASAIGSAGTYKFDNSAGAVIEAEFLSDENWGLKLRYVNEKLTYKDTDIDFDGSHVGLFANIYF